MHLTFDYAVQILEPQQSGTIKAESATTATEGSAETQKKRSRKARARRLSYVDNRGETDEKLKAGIEDTAEEDIGVPDKQVLTTLERCHESVRK